MDRIVAVEAVKKLRVGSADDQEDAAETIRDLACRGTVEDKVALFRTPGLVPALSEVLWTRTGIAQEQAVSAIEELAYADANKVPLFEAPGLLSGLVEVLQNGTARAQGVAVLAISNLASVGANRVPLFEAPGLLSGLVEVLQNGDAYAQQYAADAIAELASVDANQVPLFEAPGLLSGLVEVIRTRTGFAQEKAVSAIAFLASADANQVPLVEAPGLLSGLSRCCLSGLVEVLKRSPSTRSRPSPSPTQTRVPLFEAPGLLSALVEVRRSGSDNAKSMADGVIKRFEESGHVVEDGLQRLRPHGPNADLLRKYLFARSQGRSGRLLRLPPGYEEGIGVIGHATTGIYVLCPPLQLVPHGDGNQDVLILYHYCPPWAFSLIIGKTWNLTHLRASSGPKNAHYGNGVYATSLAPHDFGSKDAVVKNNYTNSSDPRKQEQDSIPWLKKEVADYCIPLIVARQTAFNVQKEKTKEMPQPGFTVLGKPIREDRDIWTIVVRDEDGPAQSAEEHLESMYVRIRDKDWSVRLHAVDVLARIAAEKPDHRATSAILQVLHDEDHIVCEAAIWAVAFSKALTNSEALQRIEGVIETNTHASVKDTIESARGFLRRG